MICNEGVLTTGITKCLLKSVKHVSKVVINKSIIKML